jgi:hypothetical protein
MTENSISMENGQSPSFVDGGLRVRRFGDLITVTAAVDEIMPLHPLVRDKDSAPEPVSSGNQMNLTLRQLSIAIDPYTGAMPDYVFKPDDTTDIMSSLREYASCETDDIPRANAALLLMDMGEYGPDIIPGAVTETPELIYLKMHVSGVDLRKSQAQSARRDSRNVKTDTCEFRGNILAAWDGAPPPRLSRPVARLLGFAGLLQ